MFFSIIITNNYIQKYSQNNETTEITYKKFMWFYFIKKQKLYEPKINTKFSIMHDNNLVMCFSDQKINCDNVLNQHGIETILDANYLNKLNKWLRIDIKNIQQSILSIKYYNPTFENIFTPKPYINYENFWLGPTSYMTNIKNCFYLVKNNNIIKDLANDEENCLIIPIPNNTLYQHISLQRYIFPYDIGNTISIWFTTID